MQDNETKPDGVLRHADGKFKKGTVSANPAGRPVKVDSLTGLLREFLGCADPGALTHRENIVRAMVALAERGDIPAIKLVWDRCEGLLTQQVQQLTKVEIVRVDDDGLAETSAVPEDE